MSIMFQDLVVTVISVGAAALVVNRVFGLVRPRAAKTGCSNCNACSESRRPLQS